MRILVRKDVYESIVKSLAESRLEYFKRKILEHLESLENQENGVAKSFSERIDDILKSLDRAHLVPKQVRAQNAKTGKTYIKTVYINPNKQNGLKRYHEQESKGSRIAIGKLKKAVENCKSAEELMQIVLRNKDRFSDENGNPLPIVSELRKYVDSKNSGFGRGKRKEEIFGHNYSGYAYKGTSAIKKILKEKNGYVEAAFFKDGIGDIDVVYGKITDLKKHKGYGLVHIQDKHPEITPELMEKIIKNGEVSKTYNGFNIKYKSFVLGLNKGYKENGKYITTDNWIVTSFEDKKRQETSTIAYARSLTGETVSSQNLPNILEKTGLCYYIRPVLASSENIIGDSRMENSFAGLTSNNSRNEEAKTSSDSNLPRNNAYVKERIVKKSSFDEYVRKSIEILRKTGAING